MNGAKTKLNPIKTVLLMMVVSAFLATAQFAFKRALGRLDTGLSTSTLLHFALQPMLWAAMGCILTATVVWGYVLRHETISRVYPLVSMSYVFTAIAGHIWLGEVLTINKFAGIGLIALGIVMLFA
jgi:drug/metabolite transporter (DMT)-like permease